MTARYEQLTVTLGTDILKFEQKFVNREYLPSRDRCSLSLPKFIFYLNLTFIDLTLKVCVVK